MVSGKPIRYIIPHNDSFRQAKLQPNTREKISHRFSHPVIIPQTPVESPLQAQARKLYDLGFNVFPQPLGKKAGFPWKRLQYTRLHRDNPRYGLTAVFHGRSNLAVMCGKTSENLFIIDCETKTSFEHHIRQLHSRSIPVWAAETARGGHIYLRSKTSEVANIDKGTLGDTEIKGCRCYVLAPPSIHPTGAIYHWLTQEGNAPPIVDISIIDWLKDKHSNPVQLRLDQPSRQRTTSITTITPNHDFSPLSRSTRDYLTNGHTITEGSRNNHLFSAACDMAGNNYTYAKTLKILAPIAQTSGLPRTEITSTIYSAFSRDRQPAKLPKTQDKRFDWQRALTYAQNHQWEGRHANSNNTTFLALIERAKLDSNENGIFRASIREISALARIGTTTTQKTLKRLQEHNPPLIFRVANDKTSGATLWRFSDSVIQVGKELKTNTLPPPPPWVRGSVSLFNCGDVLERGALGMSGLWLYQVMSGLGRPAMPKVLAAESGLTVNQVNYALKKFCSFGVAERCSDGWVVVQCGLDELGERVSRAAGTSGKGQARRQRYATERAIHVGRVVLEARHKQEWSLFSAGSSWSGFDSAVVVDALPSPVLQSSCCGSKEGGVKFWECPNCGQTHFGDSPPDMCDVCRDFTTWREIDPPPEFDDPLILLALELGGVLSDRGVCGVNPWFHA